MIKADPNNQSNTLLEISKTQHFEVGATNNVAKYVNHCVPGYFDQNCDIVRHENKFYIQTTREVKPGQEFYCDYGDGYWKK